MQIVSINKFEFKEKMIRAKDIVEIFVNISESTVLNWWKEGLMPRHNIAGSKFYKLSDIERIIDESEEWYQPSTIAKKRVS